MFLYKALLIASMSWSPIILKNQYHIKVKIIKINISFSVLAAAAAAWESTESIRRRLVDVIRPHVFACWRQPTD